MLSQAFKDIEKCSFHPQKNKENKPGECLKHNNTRINTWSCFYQRMDIKSRQSLHVSMLKCLEPALALIASRWRHFLLHNEVCLYINLWEKDPTYHLIYDLVKHFIHKLVVSCVSFLSYGIKRDAITASLESKCKVYFRAGFTYDRCYSTRLQCLSTSCAVVLHTLWTHRELKWSRMLKTMKTVLCSPRLCFSHFPVPDHFSTKVQRTCA